MFALFLVVFFGAAWLAFQVVAPAYRKALAVACEQLYGQRYDFEAVGPKLVFRSYARPAFEADLSTQGVSSNVPFLLTLLLVTPGMSWLNRSWRLAAGLALLFASQVFFVATKVEVALIAAAHPQAGTPWLWNTADNFFEITGKAFFPVLIWMLFSFPYMMGQVDQRSAPQPVAKPGRNAPCPCGSGKKYKHCCGG